MCQFALKSRVAVRITRVHNGEYGIDYGLERQSNRRAYHPDYWYYRFDPDPCQFTDALGVYVYQYQRRSSA